MSSSVFSTLTGVLTGKHPELGILCRETGEVLVPKSGNNPAHWTYGSKRPDGYSYVRIGGKSYLCHRLVVETYLGAIPEGCEIDHINRCRSSNFLDNLRIVTHSTNLRNTAAHDRVTERGGTHWYENKRQYDCEQNARYRAENPDKIREKGARYYAENKDKILEKQSRYFQDKRKTHKWVKFADGTHHWIPHDEAALLLAIPLKERHYGK